MQSPIGRSWLFTSLLAAGVAGCGTDSGSREPILDEPTAVSRSAVSSTARLAPSDRELRDAFGENVAVSGNVAVVSAGNKTSGGLARAGAAYVFEYSVGSGWTQKAKLTAPVPESGAQFGKWSVSTDGNRILVATGTKEAHIFVKDGGSWNHDGVLKAPATSPSDFGMSSCILGDIAVVGADMNEPGMGPFVAGAAYVFTRKGSLWQQTQELSASDATASDSFGASCAMEGGTLVIGAFGAHARPVTRAGAAYVFTLDTGGLFQERAKLVAVDPRSDSAFGTSVGISGNLIIVAAPRAKFGAGFGMTSAAYIFRRTGSAWSQEDKIEPTIATGDHGRFDLFGVAISGNTAVLKKHSTVKIYSFSGDKWVFQESLATPSDVNLLTGLNRVAMSGRFVLINSNPVLAYLL